MVKIKSALLLMILWTAFACNNTEKGGPTAQNASADTTAAKKEKTILVFGNSLTAGYGLEDPAEAFPSLIQRKLDSMQLPYKVVNAGVSGETSSGGNSRIDWVLRQPVDVFVLELGANDGLRGIPVEETEKNLQSIIDKVKSRYPEAKIIITGMQVPPNMGGTYASAFKNIFSNLAKNNKAILVPFLLEGVGGEADLNQQDGIHPTAEGHKILAENVWVKLKDELN